ncbi:MAG: DNA gyrase inhibitor YacG [Gemmatales bacterium]|nr:MAG: DNA gyrase inhibitor YacG [Gemmatales bacterium]
MIKVRCPICDKEMAGHSKDDWPAFPFCSQQCRLIDLGRWLGEKYRIPASEDEVPDDDKEETVP